MDTATRKRLEAAGWRTGTVAELLGLTPSENAFIEMKLALARAVRTLRERQQLSQSEAAERLGSSQSRLSKIEAAEASVSLDLLVRSALELGATRGDVAQVLRGKPVPNGTGRSQRRSPPRPSAKPKLRGALRTRRLRA